MSEDDARHAREATLAAFKRYFFESVPHNEALGMEMAGIDGYVVHVRLPYNAYLVGNPDTGVIHGGVITTLLDATGGAAVFVRMQAPTPIATLDLRIDYLRPATPDQAILAEAECYKLTHNVAFVRGLAHHGDRDDPIASAVGTYAILQRRRRTSAPPAQEGAS